MEILQLLLNFFTDYSYFAVFLILLACGFGIPIPEDISLVAGGVISGLGHANVHVMVAVSLLGVLTGDSCIFMTGRHFGERVLRFRTIAKVLTPKRFAIIQQKFERYGNWLMFFARFLPGMRTAVFVSAGVSRRVSYWQFLLMDSAAALISVPLWVYLGHWGASNLEDLMKWVHRGQASIFIAVSCIILVGSLLIYRKQKRKKTQTEK